MKNSVRIGVSFSLAILFIFGVFGCTPSFPAVTDQEIIKAIKESEHFSPTTCEHFVLKSPIQIVEKKKDEKNTSWIVTAHMTVTFKLADGKESPEMTRSPKFRVNQSKDSTGATIWKADLIG